MAHASWDLAFYNVGKFRIMINHMTGESTMMTYKTDLNSVKPSEIHISDLAVGQGKGTLSLIDDWSGDLDKTVIKEISASENANKVHIVSSGGAHIANNLMKVRVLRHPNGWYTVQYTKINDANFKTLVVDKNTTHHFTYVSFDTGIVNIEPAKKDRDCVWNQSIYRTNYGGSCVPQIL